MSLVHVAAAYINDVRVVLFVDTFFNRFESGDFTGLDWVVGGEGAWPEFAYDHATGTIASEYNLAKNVVASRIDCSVASRSLKVRQTVTHARSGSGAGLGECRAPPRKLVHEKPPSTREAKDGRTSISVPKSIQSTSAPPAPRGKYVRR